ncbi:uncharacterized protein LOC9643626 [Selaginella moellendorffii]|nr:uncharacterized protein LOC9643626 [Selaginella moellendorffii]|eukprot:XP_002963813.2 uncharacterized protein LOC9643626 [Selaginella moellendorffii]
MLRLALRRHGRWRLSSGCRHFCDRPSDANAGKEERDAQIEMLDDIIQDVKTDTIRRAQESKRGKKEPTFGELFGALSLTDAELSSWFKSEDFPDEQRPILEELSPDEIKMRLKEKRRVAEMQRLKKLADSRVRVVDDQGRSYARGGRKTSQASVWLSEGSGNIMVNKMSHDLYFRQLDHRVHILEPFCVTNTLGKFDVKALVRGGGLSGQAGAVRHGISRAIQLFDPSLRLPLRRGGYLTRDPRIVERKKPGRAKARKGFQWVKR